MDILFYEDEDKDFSIGALKEAEIVLRSAREYNLLKAQRAEYYIPKTRQYGYCILCGRHLDYDYDIEKPLCIDCYEERDEWDKSD